MLLRADRELGFKNVTLGGVTEVGRSSIPTVLYRKKQREISFDRGAYGAIE
jgi:hypothetical protein